MHQRISTGTRIEPPQRDSIGLVPIVPFFGKSVVSPFPHLLEVPLEVHIGRELLLDFWIDKKLKLQSPRVDIRALARLCITTIHCRRILVIAVDGSIRAFSLLASVRGAQTLVVAGLSQREPHALRVHALTRKNVRSDVAAVQALAVLRHFRTVRIYLAVDTNCIRDVTTADLNMTVVERARTSIVTIDVGHGAADCRIASVHGTGVVIIAIDGSMRTRAELVANRNCTGVRRARIVVIAVLSLIANRATRHKLIETAAAWIATVDSARIKIRTAEHTMRTSLDRMTIIPGTGVAVVTRNDITLLSIPAETHAVFAFGVVRARIAVIAQIAIDKFLLALARLARVGSAFVAVVALAHVRLLRDIGSGDGTSINLLRRRASVDRTRDRKVRRAGSEENGNEHQSLDLHETLRKVKRRRRRRWKLGESPVNRHSTFERTI